MGRFTGLWETGQVWWYWIKSGEWRGFIARSVVGGVYMELLQDKLKDK